MPNNTETYWDINGQSLHTFARSIETLGGIGIPNYRGEDYTIPYRPGEVWVPKELGSNVITLLMWLRGVAQNAGVNAAASKAQYQSNWNDLIRLLIPQPGNQLQLTKRFYDGGVLRTAMALAEYNGGMQPKMIGNAAGKCSIDLKLADPNFYDVNTVNTALPNGNTVVNNPGNNTTYNMAFTINGARNNLLIENLTTGVQFTYSGQIASGTVVIVNPKDFVATEQVGAGSPFDSSIKVIGAGSPFWFNLAPGNNTIRVSSTSGTGTVTLASKGAWL